MRSFPKLHQRYVHCDPMQPCGQCRSALKLMHFLKHPDKHLLRPVFGLGWIPDYAETQPINALAIQAIDIVKREIVQFWVGQRRRTVRVKQWSKRSWCCGRHSFDVQRKMVGGTLTPPPAQTRPAP